MEEVEAVLSLLVHDLPKHRDPPVIRAWATPSAPPTRAAPAALRRGASRGLYWLPRANTR